MLIMALVTNAKRLYIAIICTRQYGSYSALQYHSSMLVVALVVLDPLDKYRKSSLLISRDLP